MTTEATSTERPTTADPIPDRLAATAPSRSAGLLALVRNLIAFGETLIRTLQSSPAAEALYRITSGFGTSDLKLIVARITRGLMIAASLDARLIRSATRLDNPKAHPVKSPTAARRPRRASTPALSQQEDDAALLARLPTAQEMAAQFRGKPIGMVLEQICQDLGITCDHPLYRDLRQAILFNGGRVPNVFRAMLARVKAGYALLPSGLLPEAIAYPGAPSFGRTGTGPP